MKRWAPLLLFLCLLASPVWAQNYTTVTASNIQDVSGAKLSSGALCFDASNATNSSSDTPSNEVSFQAGGGGQVLRGPICTPITTGAIGTFQVPNSANTIPAGVVYHIYVIQGSYHLLDYYQVSVTGTTWSFDTYNPNTPVGAVPSGASVNGPLTVNGDLAVTGSFTPGTLGNTSISGTLAVSGTSTMTGALTANGNGAAGNVPIKPALADAIQYVSANGSDSNDGLSWGTAKATIAGAYAALPSCAVGSTTYTHCGRIQLGAQAVSYSSQFTSTSPYVSINGISPWATTIQYTGTTGCAIQFVATSAINTYPGNMNAENLADLTIDGTSAGAGTCGLETTDIDSFHARNVSIMNFSGTGSVGWLDNVVNYFDERYDVSMTLGNNTVGWKMEGGVGQSGYTDSNTTFGYGNFNLWINTNASGQVGVWLDNYAVLTYSDLFIVENMVTGTTAVQLTNHSSMTGDLTLAHFEGGTTGFNADSTSYVEISGAVHETSPMADTFSNTTTPSYLLGQMTDRVPDGIGIVPVAGSGQSTFRIGSNSDIQNDAALAIGIPSSDVVWPLTISEAGTQIFGVGKDGSIQFGGGPYGGDAYKATLNHDTFTANQTFYLPNAGGTLALQGGSCAMSSGTNCTSTVSYGTHCVAVVQGTSPIAGACSISGTTLTVTAASSNSDTWAWMIVN